MTSATAVRTFRLWITSLKQQKHIHTPNFSNINTNTQILTFCVITVLQYIFLFSFYHKTQMQPLQQLSCSWTAVDQTTWHRYIIWDQMEFLKTDNSYIPLFQHIMQQTQTFLAVIIFSRHYLLHTGCIFFSILMFSLVTSCSSSILSSLSILCLSFSNASFSL